MKIRSNPVTEERVRMKRKNALGIVFLLFLLSACQTSQTYWVPVYSLKYGITTEKTTFDSRINSVVNPEEGVLVAYYETDTKKATVYGNDYSMSLAEKVVITNDEIAAKLSTPKLVTNLDLFKSFYYDYFSETEKDRKLYVYRDSTLMALDHSLIGDDKIIEYVIIGKNVGTNAISQIVIADILPKGFVYVASEYSVDAKVGSFEHKVITKNDKTSIVLASNFIKPLPPADVFRLKIRLRAQFDKMGKEFDY
jgi:uncharacterized repeat protein (TIGR01451 family)